MYTDDDPYYPGPEGTVDPYAPPPAANRPLPPGYVPPANQPPGFNPFPPDPNPTPPGWPDPTVPLPPAPVGGPGPSPWANLWKESGQDPQKFVQAFIQQHNLVGHQTDPLAIQQIIGALNSVGYNATINKDPHGYYKGINLSDGKFVKLLDGNDNWIWDMGGGAAGGGVSAFGAPGGVGAFTEPWNEPFVPPEWTTGIYAPPGVPEYPDFQAPDKFVAPDENAVLQDPSYKLRLQEGADVLSNQAGAAGRLREGGFLKELLKYGQMFGSTEYGNVYGRKASEYDRNWEDTLKGYTTNRDTALGRFGLTKGNYDSLWNAKNAARDTAYQQYRDRENAFRTNQDAAFDKWYKTSSLGLNASA